MRPIRLNQPSAAVPQAQHLLLEGAPRGCVAQVTHMGFDGARQPEARLCQHHQRHAAAVQLVLHHRCQVGAALALRESSQFGGLEQRLVQPAHQGVGINAAAFPVHGHLGAARGAQRDTGTVHADLENV